MVPPIAYLELYIGFGLLDIKLKLPQLLTYPLSL